MCRSWAADPPPPPRPIPSLPASTLMCFPHEMRTCFHACVCVFFQDMCANVFLFWWRWWTDVLCVNFVCGCVRVKAGAICRRTATTRLRGQSGSMFRTHMAMCPRTQTFRNAITLSIYLQSTRPVCACEHASVWDTCGFEWPYHPTFNNTRPRSFVGNYSTTNIACVIDHPPPPSPSHRPRKHLMCSCSCQQTTARSALTSVMIMLIIIAITDCVTPSSPHDSCHRKTGHIYSWTSSSEFVRANIACIYDNLYCMYAY